MFEQRRLSDAGFPAHDEHPAAPGARPGHQHLDRFALGAATQQIGQDRSFQSSRLPYYAILTDANDACHAVPAFAAVSIGASTDAKAPPPMEA